MVTRRSPRVKYGGSNRKDSNTSNISFYGIANRLALQVEPTQSSIFLNKFINMYQIRSNQDNNYNPGDKSLS